MKVYISGAMFTEAEIDYNLGLARDLRGFGFDVYCPNENLSISDKTRRDITGEMIYAADTDAILSCNILLCQISDDPGTMWEAGYMDCLSRHVDPARYLGVIGLTTDIRLASAPDPARPSYDNQTFYINQMVVGGLKMSLGIFTSRMALFAELVRIRDVFDLAVQDG